MCYYDGMSKTTIEVELPPKLADQAISYVEEGWAVSLNELMAEALRRFLDSHDPQVMEQFLKEDIAWGLYGKD